MPKSMTGFGRGLATGEDLTVICQLRAVNSRFGELNLRLPQRLLPYETALRRQLQQGSGRGKLDVTLDVRRSETAAPQISLDLPLVHAYADALRSLSREIGGSFNYEPNPEYIASYPGVITQHDVLDEAAAIAEGTHPQLAHLLEEAARAALQQFNDNRAAEGERLAADLRDRLAQLEALRQELSHLAPAAQEEYERHLRSRLDQLLGEQSSLVFDEQRLAAEVLVFADKSAIDEEVVRLGSHIEGALALLEPGREEPVGKQLDFLIQEMNREINTVGSKSNDLELTKLVVSGKTIVEQIRQQVQNLE